MLEGGKTCQEFQWLGDISISRFRRFRFKRRRKRFGRKLAFKSTARDRLGLYLRGVYESSGPDREHVESGLRFPFRDESAASASASLSSVRILRVGGETTRARTAALSR